MADPHVHMLNIIVKVLVLMCAFTILSSFQ